MRNLNEAPTEEGDVGPTTIGELIKAQMRDAINSADAGIARLAISEDHRRSYVRYYQVDVYGTYRNTISSPAPQGCGVSGESYFRPYKSPIGRGGRMNCVDSDPFLAQKKSTCWKKSENR